jgi:tetratricopeptide (TPR) repeat protein
MVFDEMPYSSYDNGEQKAQKAFELYEDGKITQAIAELNDALEINPASCSLHFNKALALDSLSKFEDAIAEYETALALNPCDLEILNSLAVDYTRVGQYDLAIATFEKIQELDAGFEPSYCNRIITYTEMGLHDQAEQMFYLAQQINPDCALCYYNIGNSLFSRGEFKKAIHCWLKTAVLEPSHPQINYHIAQALWAENELERCRQHFLKELRLNPGDDDVIIDFGLFQLERGEIEPAKEKFHRVLELKPDKAVALFYLGEIAADERNKASAIKLYNQAMERDGLLAGPRYRLGQYALEKGELQKAQAYLASEIKLANNDADVLVSMASMFLVIASQTHAANDKDEALDLATGCLLRAIDIDGCDDDAYYYLGLANAMRGEFEDAAEFFAHALDINPQYVQAIRDSAIVHLAMRRLEDAAQIVERGVLLLGDHPHLKDIRRKVRRSQIARQLADIFGHRKH